MANSATWTETGDGYRCKTIERNGCTISIFRPVLGQEEKAKREAHVQTVAAQALKNYLIQKGQL